MGSVSWQHMHTAKTLHHAAVHQSIFSITINKATFQSHPCADYELLSKWQQRNPHLH
jgi:hypothetical protein